MSKKRTNKKVTFDIFQSIGFVKLWYEDAYYFIKINGSCKYFKRFNFNRYFEQKCLHGQEILQLVCDQFKFITNYYSGGSDFGDDDWIEVDLYQKKHYDFIVNMVKFLLENCIIRSVFVSLLDFNDNVIESYDSDVAI